MRYIITTLTILAAAGCTETPVAQTPPVTPIAASHTVVYEAEAPGSTAPRTADYTLRSDDGGSRQGEIDLPLRNQNGTAGLTFTRFASGDFVYLSVQNRRRVRHSHLPHHRRRRGAQREHLERRLHHRHLPRPGAVTPQGGTMALKPCLDCGQVSDQARCPTHRAEYQRKRDAKRGTAADRGYGKAHKLERERWRPKVEAGLVECWRCHEPIEPTSEWDLGHDDVDRSKYKGPEHVLCNRRTSGRTVTAPQRWEL